MTADKRLAATSTHAPVLDDVLRMVFADKSVSAFSTTGLPLLKARCVLAEFLLKLFCTAWCRTCALRHFKSFSLKRVESFHY